MIKDKEGMPMPKKAHFGLPQEAQKNIRDWQTRREDEFSGVFKYQQPLIEQYFYDKNGKIQNSFRRPRRDQTVRMLMSNA
jgi:hypothetical protein